MRCGATDCECATAQADLRVLALGARVQRPVGARLGTVLQGPAPRPAWVYPLEPAHGWYYVRWDAPLPSSDWVHESALTPLHDAQVGDTLGRLKQMALAAADLEQGARYLRGRVAAGRQSGLDGLAQDLQRRATALAEQAELLVLDLPPDGRESA